MCERGTTQEVIIDGKSISIDDCIADDVQAINTDGEFRTLGSCCGHGLYPRTIVVRDEHLPFKVLEYYTRVPVPRRRRFYRRDANGFYFIPEIIEKVSK